jgi:hypothetical protein
MFRERLREYCPTARTANARVRPCEKKKRAHNCRPPRELDQDGQGEKTLVHEGQVEIGDDR